MTNELLQHGGQLRACGYVGKMDFFLLYRYEIIVTVVTKVFLDSSEYTILIYGEKAILLVSLWNKDEG